LYSKASILPRRDIDFTFETYFSKNLDRVGQAGGYASRAFASLGLRTTFVGYVGDDHNGHLVFDDFSRDRIDSTDLLVDPSGASRENFMAQSGY
jgi:sugar/nucleoside kinase (ribokinase family)